MFERQKILDKNKYEKLQVLKSMDFEKEYSECVFKPVIVKIFHLIKIF